MYPLTVRSSNALSLSPNIILEVLWPGHLNWGWFSLPRGYLIMSEDIFKQFIFILGCTGSLLLCVDFPSCDEWGDTLWLLCLGFSLQWPLFLQSMGYSCPRHVESSQTRDQTCVPYLGRQILTHSTTWESWGHFWLSQLRGRCCWHSGGRVQGCLLLYILQGIDIPTTKELLYSKCQWCWGWGILADSSRVQHTLCRISLFLFLYIS